MLMFHIIKTSQFKHMSGSRTIKHTSFFTVKPIDTDTNGNLQKRTLQYKAFNYGTPFRFKLRGILFHYRFSFISVV